MRRLVKAAVNGGARRVIDLLDEGMGNATMLWSDEFAGSSLSLAASGGTWRTKGYEAGGTLATGYTDFVGSSWNVSPAEHPADFPAAVADSVLTITAKRNPGLSGVSADWIGAYLVTDHIAGLAWRFGYFEWRARLPNSGRGMFPALWLFNTVAGRSDGKEGAEIDMLEVFGEPDGQPWSSGYHNRPVPGVGFNAGNFDTDTAGWHRYGVEWTPTALRYYRDGAQVAEVTGPTAEWFATADLGVRINYAMDPSWLAAGDPNRSTSSDPAPGTELRMLVDYIRVFDRKPSTLPTGPNDPLLARQFVSTRPATGPARTEVINAHSGAWVATLTDGARTVTLAGPQRTFTEQKAAGVDQFDRVVAPGWGRSPNLGSWGDFNGSATDYTVSGGKGRIASPTTNVSRYVRLNDTVSDFDARVSFTTDTTPAGNANSFSLVGGWTDASNHYRFRLTFNSTGSVSAAITRNVAGAETVLSGSATVAASGYVAGQVWHIRGARSGTALSMWAWKDGDPVPGSPTLTATDSAFTSGKLGCRAFASTGSTNSPTFLVEDYQVTSATWPSPPAVTHSTWVRLLAAPFTGTLDTAWLVSAITATSPDLLAVAMEYVTGGSKGASYGPLYAPGRSWDVGHADDGTRQEGADWNDYLGVTGSYPGLTTTTDAAEAHQLGCLDCSGFVRTVFGYRGDRGVTLPMCLDDPADFNGLRIPRRSVDQAASGPGLSVVFSPDSAPTDLSQAKPGDVLFWDADTSNPAEEEGQIDHSGIYLGVDSAGGVRFLSSRKTADGPTMSDLGGPSVITGTSLYGPTLRRVRRF